MSLPNGFIAYRGPSLLNGAPVVCVVIRESVNAKTGNVAQAYILAAHDRPVVALRDGTDEAICGDCKHRAVYAGTCYVVVRQGASVVWKNLEHGSYPDFSHCPDLVSELLRGRHMRLGAYGDPAAVPVQVWRDLTSALAGWVGYTHQWRRADAQELREFCMASVDSPRELDLARALGWRTFRVRTPDEPIARREAMCPASEEGGNKLTCVTCGFCDGTHRGRSGGAAILLHGNHLRDREQRFLASRGEKALPA